MSTLHRVRGRNRYCGPSAIAAVLGITTDEAAAALRPVRYGIERLADAKTTGRPPPAIKTVSDIELITTLNELGCRLDVIFRPDRPTLRRWLAENAHDDANYILHVRRHYIACNPAVRTVVDRIFGGRKNLAVRRGPGRDRARYPRQLDEHPEELRQLVKCSFRLS